MATWTGWAADFLAAASLPNTDENRQFLNDWADHANSPGCANNPIDLTHHEPGSSNCGGTNISGVHIQRYTSHTWARTAFNSDIHSGDFPHLLDALKSGHPYGIDKPGPVATDLGRWASTKFANVYLDEAGAGGGDQLHVPHAHKGWADLRHSVNVKLPNHLKQSQKVREASLRQLAQVRKVLR